MSWVQIMIAVSTAIAIPLVAAGYRWNCKNDYEEKIQQEREAIDRKWIELDEMRMMLAQHQRELESKVLQWRQLQRDKDQRIKELREKNAVLTGYLCRKFRSDSQQWPEGRKKRAGRKLNRELAANSEGCSQWCLIAPDGVPPEK
jgi:septal ring factor EnvC (AmiA/AmiB activator)